MGPIRKYKHLCLHITAWLSQFCQQNLQTTPRLTKSLTAHTFQGVIVVHHGMVA